MRRSICYSDPAVALAGEKRTWKFTYSPGVTLPKGTALQFDLGCRGRSIDWQIPSVHVKEGSNVIWAELDNGKKLYAKAVDIENNIVPRYEFILPQEVVPGKHIYIFLGTPNETALAEEDGTMAQLTLQRRRPFYLFIDTTAKGNWAEPEVFTMDVKGSALHTIKVLAPSQVVKNKRFDVVLRFEDMYGNLTNSAPENTLIELSHDNLRDNLKWKLFLPETGYIALPNLYFNDVGVYTIRLKNMTTGEEFYSAPIKCLPIESKNVFWGTLHGESERFDSTENIESCLRHFRDEKSMNFYATSLPDSQDETPNDIWKSVCQNIAEFNEEDRFVTFLGQQWSGSGKLEGSRIFINSKDDKAIVRSKDIRSNSLEKVYKLHSPKEMISIPSFTMSSTDGYPFDTFDSDFERVAEIYNAWGSSECTAKEGNIFPITSKSKKGAVEYKEGSLLNALKRNKRFGFVSGGLDDRSVYAQLFDTDQKQYNPGLTAILSDQYSRSSLFDALYNRHCYATTGERIIVGFSIAHHIMGSELSTLQKPGLHINRHIAGYVAGTTPIEKVEIVRNGDTIHTIHPVANSADFEYDDMEPLSHVSLKDEEKKQLFSFYYVRVTQKDGNMAWSSPIWVDCVGDIKSKKVSLQPLPPSVQLPSSQSTKQSGKQVKKPAATAAISSELTSEHDVDKSLKENKLASALARNLKKQAPSKVKKK